MESASLRSPGSKKLCHVTVFYFLLSVEYSIFIVYNELKDTEKLIKPLLTLATRTEVKTYSSSASLVSLSQFAQVLWYLLLVCFRYRLHTLQVGVSGVTPGKGGQVRGQFHKKKMNRTLVLLFMYPMSCSCDRSLENGMKSTMLSRALDLLEPARQERSC